MDLHKQLSEVADFSRITGLSHHESIMLNTAIRHPGVLRTVLNPQY